jgi:hypothetical protein
MTKNEMIDWIASKVWEKWNNGRQHEIRELAEEICALFPDQQYDYEWQVPDKNTPVDANAYVRNSVIDQWLRRHFAKPGCCWDGGATSFTTGGIGRWDMIVLADPNDPLREPPTDYVPKQKEVKR